MIDADESKPSLIHFHGLGSPVFFESEEESSGEYDGRESEGRYKADIILIVQVVTKGSK